MTSTDGLLLGAALVVFWGGLGLYLWRLRRLETALRRAAEGGR
ncbi:MAG: hypothetical protein ACT4PT_11100 [Methanobacteriota archaeon]